MTSIIDEIAEIRHDFLLQGIEPNTIIIPESRRNEAEYLGIYWAAPGNSAQNGKKYVFGCEVVYSTNADKIKVGYIV